MYFKESSTIEFPTDLISQHTHWNVNDGKGQIHPGVPFEIEYHPEQENENSYRVVQDNYVEEEKYEWPPTTFYFADGDPESPIVNKVVAYRPDQET